MQFYGLSYQAVLDLPLRVFWALSRYVNPLRAEDDMRGLHQAAAVAGGHEAINTHRDALAEELGTPVIVIEKLDRAGLAALKNLPGIGSTKAL